MHRLFQQAKNWKTFLKSFKDGLIFLYLTTFIYDICIINTGGLLFFQPTLEPISLFSRALSSCKFSPYVQLVFKRGL